MSDRKERTQIKVKRLFNLIFQFSNRLEWTRKQKIVKNRNNYALFEMYDEKKLKIVRIVEFKFEKINRKKGINQSSWFENWA